MSTSTRRRGPALALCVLMLCAGADGRAEEGEPISEQSTEDKVRTIFDSLGAINSTAMSRPQPPPRPAPDPKTGVLPDPPPSPKFTGKEIAKELEVIRKFAAAVQEEDLKRRGLDGKIVFGGGSDESASADKSKVNVGAELTLGTYPGQLRVRFESAVEQNASSIKENVTSIVASYDHYIKPGREAFGFLERFTDSFLDIDQRYEIGLGMKFEWTKKGAYERKQWFQDFQRLRSTQLASADDPKKHPLGACEDAYTTAGCKAMKELLEKREKAEASVAKVKEHAETDEDFGAAVKDLVEAVEAVDLTDILNGKRKATTKWELGFAVGALAEFEMPAALKRNVNTTKLMDLNGDGIDEEVPVVVERAFNQPSSQRFRLSLRPSVVWRLGQRTEIFAKAYYKPALDSPRHVDGERDYRADLYAGLKWRFPGIQKKDGTTSITLNYELHYDNVPPESAETLAVNETFVEGSRELVSAKRHRMIKLGVEIPL